MITSTEIMKQKIYKEEIKPLIDLKYHILSRTNPVIKIHFPSHKITLEYDPITDRLIKDIEKQIERIWLRSSADAALTLVGALNVR